MVIESGGQMMLRVAMMSGIIFTLSKLHSFSVPISGGCVGNPARGRHCGLIAPKTLFHPKFVFEWQAVQRMLSPARGFDDLTTSPTPPIPAFTQVLIFSSLSFLPVVLILKVTFELIIWFNILLPEVEIEKGCRKRFRPFYDFE